MVPSSLQNDIIMNHKTTCDVFKSLGTRKKTKTMQKCQYSFTMKLKVDKR